MCSSTPSSGTGSRGQPNSTRCPSAPTRAASTLNHYRAMVLVTSPEEIETIGKRSQERLETVMYQLNDLWREEFLPEIEQYLEYWDGFDLHGASMPELLGHLDETMDRLERLWEIHFRVAFPRGL